MKIGAHVSSAGGLWHAPENAHKIGCETFQFFTRSPQGGPTPPLTNDIIKKFRETCEKCNLNKYAVHAPYFINFASKEARVRHASARIIREELERSSKLGVTYVMAHLGSAKDAKDEKSAAKMVIEGLQNVMDGYKGTTQFLIEISAGAGMVIGDTFEEIATLIDSVKTENGQLPIAVCFDTQHAFASGYDLRTEKTVKETLKKLDDVIGLERIMMSHCNDSKVDLGEHKDRHEHLGDGKIGLEGFEALLHTTALKHWLLILETPWDGKEKTDLELLKKLRKSHA